MKKQKVIQIDDSSPKRIKQELEKLVEKYKIVQMVPLGKTSYLFIVEPLK